MPEIMTQKERVTNALNKTKVDRPPFICPGGMMNIVTTEIMEQLGVYWPEAHSDAAELVTLGEGVYKLTGIENIGVPFCMTVEAEAMGAEVNLGSIGNEPMIQRYPLHNIEDFNKLNRLGIFSGRVNVILEALQKLAERNKEVAVIANLTGPVSLATSLVEPMLLFRMMGKDPELVAEFLNFVTENLIYFGKMQLQAGAAILTVSDPSASGEILGPKRFSEFALPFINRILTELKDYYDASMVHICGNLRSVFAETDLLKTKAISIDSATRVDMISNALKNKVIVGNVSTQMLLTGKPGAVKNASVSCLRRGAKVLAPACGISPKTPLQNLKAMALAVNQSDINRNQ